MNRSVLLRISERWFRCLQRFYPPDFRDEMSGAVVEAYMDRAQSALGSRGALGLAPVWLRAFADSIRNGAAERLRPAASWRRAGNWGRDFELTGRRMLRSPIFAMTTAGTLAIGLGMFAVAYTAVQKILIDPLPYKNPAGLHYVWRDYGPASGLRRAGLSGTDIEELRKPNAVIEDAAGLRPFLGGIFVPREGAEPMEIAATWVSPNLFGLLGVTPALGRGFAPDEVGPGRGQVMILTDRLWKQLGADPRIAGTEVRLQGRPFTVIGVLPPEFTFVRSDAAAAPQRVDAYIPFEVDLARTDPHSGGYAGLIRAREGASPEAVADAVERAGRVIDARDFGGRGLKLFAIGLKADILIRVRPALLVLAGAGIVLVFMLLVNLASVLLARTAQREHELAVSRALGANTFAIVRATVLEAALLGTAGGVFGTLLAVWGARALAALAPLDLPRREAIAVDWRIALTVIGVGALLGVLAAIAPSAWAARAQVASLLAASAVRGGGGHGRLRRGLIVSQVALSLVLLSSGALVVRSFERLMRADPGFRPDGVFTVRLRTPPELFPKMSEAAAFQDRVQGALAGIPGVSGASAASALPLTAAAMAMTIAVPGAAANTGDERRDKVLADMIAVRPGYVEVMGMRLLAGRTFGVSRQINATEALIDTALAQRFFAGRNPVGAEILLGERVLNVIGVFNQARLYDLHADGRPQVLVRSEDFGVRPLFFVMRTTREPHSLLPDVRTAVHRIDSRVPVGEPRSMDDIVQASLRPQAIGGLLISAFAAGGLLLAALGLYGVVSGSVTRRRHELAVRLALGADHRGILGLVLKEGALLVIAGLMIGAPGIYGATRLIRGLLAGVSSADPLALTGAATGLLAVTLATCLLSARRVLRIDPAELLRRA